MGGVPAPDWTTGPAKWAAIAVLGAASIVGIVWSIARDLHDAREGAPRPITSRADTIDRAPADAPNRATPEPTPQTTTRHAPTPVPARIDLNTATQAQLEVLPGVGPALAARIIEYRTEHGAFRSVEQLDAVKGIGPKLMEKIRPLVKVSDDAK